VRDCFTTTLSGTAGISTGHPLSCGRSLHSQHACLLWVLRASVKYVELSLQAARHEFVHGDVAPVERKAADAILHVRLPSYLRESRCSTADMSTKRQKKHATTFGLMCGWQAPDLVTTR
jgi:hypothetical protein